MSTEAPKPGSIPGWGQPAAEPAPAPSAQPGPAAQPAPGTGSIPGWGQQPATPEAAPASQPGPAWGAPPPATPPPATPGAPAGWNASSGPASPGGTPPGAWNPAPASSSGSSGCLKLALILVAVGAIALTVFVVGVLLLGKGLVDSMGGVNNDGSVGKPCTIVDNATLSGVLGSKAEAIQLDGLWDATIGMIADKRVLPNAYDCWITADESTPLGRIAEYQGGDAAAVYQQELKNAQPTSQDQGGGVSLENSGYFAGSVSGLGDEAFCTGVSTAIQAGVLVRKGDTLLYVSLSGPGDGTVPSMEPTDSGVIAAPGICAEAQAVARAILH